MKNEKRGGGGGVGESVENVEEEELKVQSYPQSETAATFQTRHEYIQKPSNPPIGSIIHFEFEKREKERKSDSVITTRHSPPTLLSPHPSLKFLMSIPISS